MTYYECKKSRSSVIQVEAVDRVSFFDFGENGRLGGINPVEKRQA